MYKRLSAKNIFSASAKLSGLLLLTYMSPLCAPVYTTSLFENIRIDMFSSILVTRAIYLIELTIILKVYFLTIDFLKWYMNTNIDFANVNMISTLEYQRVPYIDNKDIPNYKKILINFESRVLYIRCKISCKVLNIQCYTCHPNIKIFRGCETSCCDAIFVHVAYTNSEYVKFIQITLFF